MAKQDPAPAELKKMSPEQRRIVDIQGHLLHLMDSEGNPTTHNIAANASVWGVGAKSGEPAGKFADLKVGDVITVSGNPGTVVVVSKPGAAPATGQPGQPPQPSPSTG